MAHYILFMYWLNDKPYLEGPSLHALVFKLVQSWTRLEAGIYSYTVHLLHEVCTNSTRSLEKWRLGQPKVTLWALFNTSCAGVTGSAISTLNAVEWVALSIQQVARRSSNVAAVF